MEIVLVGHVAVFEPSAMACLGSQSSNENISLLICRTGLNITTFPNLLLTLVTTGGQ